MSTTAREDSKAPRLAFLGFCDRAEELMAGHVVFWRQNILGISNARVFFVFPTNLRGLKLVLGIYQPKTGEQFKLIFRSTGTDESFSIDLTISGSAYAMSEKGEASVIETTGDRI